MTDHFEDVDLALEVLEELRGEFLAGDGLDGDRRAGFLRIAGRRVGPMWKGDRGRRAEKGQEEAARISSRMTVGECMTREITSALPRSPCDSGWGQRSLTERYPLYTVAKLPLPISLPTT